MTSPHMCPRCKFMHGGRWHLCRKCRTFLSKNPTFGAKEARDDALEFVRSLKEKGGRMHQVAAGEHPGFDAAIRKALADGTMEIIGTRDGMPVIGMKGDRL